MMPAAIQRMFGSKNGPLIYGLIYSAFGTAALVTMFVSKVRTSFQIYVDFLLNLFLHFQIDKINVAASLFYIFDFLAPLFSLPLIFSILISPFFPLYSWTPLFPHILCIPISQPSSTFLYLSLNIIFLKAMIIGFGWTRVFHVLASVSVFAAFLTSMLKPLRSLPSSSV